MINAGAFAALTAGAESKRRKRLGVEIRSGSESRAKAPKGTGNSELFIREILCLVLLGFRGRTIGRPIRREPNRWSTRLLPLDYCFWKRVKRTIKKRRSLLRTGQGFPKISTTFCASARVLPWHRYCQRQRPFGTMCAPRRNPERHSGRFRTARPSCFMAWARPASAAFSSNSRGFS